ncbi:MAG: hypothetical protein QXG38_00455 [Candidatus Hadarchaeales archaeon]
MGIPVYGGATGFSIPSDMKSAFGIPENAGCEGHRVTTTLQDVASRYKGQLTDWALEKENTFSPPDQPNVTIGMLLYKRGDNGAFILS